MNSNQDNTCIRLLADPIQIQACKEKLKNADISLTNLAQVLNLAGNEVRLKILYLLDQEGELCPCDLSDILGMTIPAVSQHLRKLKDVNLIQFRREGQTIFYSPKGNHADIVKPLFHHIQQKEFAI